MPPKPRTKSTTEKTAITSEPLAPGIGELLVKANGVKNPLNALSGELTLLYKEFEKKKNLTPADLPVLRKMTIPCHEVEKTVKHGDSLVECKVEIPCHEVEYQDYGLNEDETLARLEQFIDFINDREENHYAEFRQMAYDLKIALAGLHAAMVSPPVGFEEVAAELWKAAMIAHTIDCKDEALEEAAILMPIIDRVHTDLHYAIKDLWSLLFEKADTPLLVDHFGKYSWTFLNASEAQVVNLNEAQEEREAKKSLAVIEKEVAAIAKVEAVKNKRFWTREEAAGEFVTSVATIDRLRKLHITEEKSGRSVKLSKGQMKVLAEALGKDFS